MQEICKRRDDAGLCKTMAFAHLLIGALLLVGASAGAQSPESRPYAHNAVPASAIGAHGLRLPASFVGTLPCADCEGVAWHLDLWPGQAFHLRRQWLGRADSEGNPARHDEVGRWHADPLRDAVVLPGTSEQAIRWEVLAPDRLRRLDREGNRIESELNYEIASDGTLMQTDLEDVFLGGMMTYLADAATFEDCLTGHRYPIVQEGAYLELERAYLRDRSAPGAPLYVHLEGGLLLRPAMEGPDRRLVVDRFIKTRPGIDCERQRANASLRNTYWRLDQLLGEDVQTLEGQREPHLILRGEESRFSATLGCNRMTGVFDVEDNRLSFQAGPTTLMACPPPLDRREREFIGMLTAAVTFRINGETLVVLNAEDEIISQFTAVYLR
ncbi:MAG: META domain-containing protein [Pseudomonadota bacterium]